MASFRGVIEYWVCEPKELSSQYVEMIRSGLRDGVGLPVTQCLSVLAILHGPDGQLVAQNTLLWYVDAAASNVTGPVPYDVALRRSAMGGSAIYKTEFAYREEDLQDMRVSMCRAKGDYRGIIAIEEFKLRVDRKTLHRDVQYSVVGSVNEDYVSRSVDLTKLGILKVGNPMNPLFDDSGDSSRGSGYDSDGSYSDSGGSEMSERDKLSVIHEEEHSGCDGDGDDDDDIV